MRRTGTYRWVVAEWMMSTDHKRIGVMYLMAILSFFSVGVVLGFMIRLSLLSPGWLVDQQTYNEFFTLHGVIQIFLFIIPGIPVAFGNIFLPILIGAQDVAFPKINRLSWWLYVSGAIIILLSLFMGGRPPDTGWTFYAPYSIQTPANVSTAVLGVFILGFSSILTGLNFVTTIHRMRAPGMRWFRMPAFPWTLYATGWVQMLATPVLAITLLFIVLGRFFGVGFFDPAKGGDPILYEHLFWMYSHPAVYIMVLPAMGIISEIVPVFSRRALFGYTAICLSALGIAIVGYAVWGHHMFTSGMSDTARVIFSFISFLVAVPSGVKIFNWVSTLYKGSISIDAPLVFALSFIFLFSIGGLTGLIIGALAPNLHLHGTYFIVGHFHYVMFGGAGFSILAGLHYWFPKITGRMYSDAVRQDRLAESLYRLQHPLLQHVRPRVPGDAEEVLRLPAAVPYEPCDLDRRVMVFGRRSHHHLHEPDPGDLQRREGSHESLGGKDAGVDDCLSASAGKLRGDTRHQAGTLSV